MFKHVALLVVYQHLFRHTTEILQNEDQSLLQIISQLKVLFARCLEPFFITVANSDALSLPARALPVESASKWLPRVEPLGRAYQCRVGYQNQVAFAPAVKI
jgi:hypothetical protein